MKLLVLGGSNVQLNAVRRLKEKGHTVIVSDYYPDAPAKAAADFGEPASTFDVEGNILVAKKYGIDGVLTLGTDQPVYTAARVAAALGLPALIDVKTAKAATNKKVMKGLFTVHGIPTVKYRIIDEGFTAEALRGLRFPVVVKPLDSQGQRGVYKLADIDGIRAVFKTVLSFSREKEILVEEYYDSAEITLSGWVHQGRPHVLAITDRVCCSNGPHIGICIAHDFPSRFMGNYGDAIIDIGERIVSAFGIRNGPVYFQMLIGSEGIKVNEIACRIGGAYEDEFIPFLTGVDVLGLLIEASLGNPPDIAPLREYSLGENRKVLSVQMLFARPGTIGAMNDMAAVKALPGVLQAGFNFKPGYAIPEIVNATARAGYIIVTGEDAAALRRNIERAYRSVYIYNGKRENLIIDFKGMGNTLNRL